MVLREEYNRLLDLFSQSAQGKPVNLEEIFKQSMAFFEHLNVQLKNGTDEEKKEALLMMSELYTQMLEQTKKICEKTGLSEEQLVSFAENPNNFSPEQWQSIREAKDKMLHVGQDLAKAVNTFHPPKKNLEAPPSPPAEKGKKETPLKKAKKSQWMRS